MPKYRYSDRTGNHFYGDTLNAVVRRMRDTAWTVVPKRRYRHEVAQRLAMLGTKNINPITSQTFLSSLVKTGWLIKG